MMMKLQQGVRTLAPRLNVETQPAEYESPTTRSGTSRTMMVKITSASPRAGRRAARRGPWEHHGRLCHGSFAFFTKQCQQKEGIQID